MNFQFLDPGPLEDAELELVLANERWFAELLEAVRHPACRGDHNADSVNPQSLRDFARVAPAGLQPGNPDKGILPAYHFLMRLKASSQPAIPVAGGMALRVGTTHDVDMYLGHVGYHVYPPARGRRLAERAVRLILPLAHRHGLNTLWITCNPDNHPSRRTCERLGAKFVEQVDLPHTHVLYQRGEKQKCRYRLDLTAFTAI